MTKTLVPAQNPALRLAKDKATSQFAATKRVLASGSTTSSIGTFPASKVIASARTHQCKK